MTSLSRETLHLVEEVRWPSKLKMILHSSTWLQMGSKLLQVCLPEIWRPWHIKHRLPGDYLQFHLQVLGGKSKDVPSAKQVEKNSRRRSIQNSKSHEKSATWPGEKQNILSRPASSPAFASRMPEPTPSWQMHRRWWRSWSSWHRVRDQKVRTVLVCKSRHPVSTSSCSSM